MSNELRSKALVAALVVAVLLRAEYLRELLLTPFGRHVVLDGVFYEQAARHILAGNPLAADPGCFRAPLYPFLLAGIRFFFPEGLLAPRLIQMLFGLVTVVLVRGLALRTHGVRVANVAGFLAAGYGMFIYHEAEILGVAVGVMLNTLAALLLLDAGRKSSLALTLAGGLTLGLTAITHATALVLAPVAFFWMLWIGRAQPRGRLALRLAALTVAVTLRNVMATGDFILVATQGGINFYVGNNAEADGRTSLVPGDVQAEYLADDEYRDLFEVAAEQIAERETGRELSASGINAYWSGRARAWMAENPGAAATLLARKALLFWTGLENSNNRDFADQAERWTPILRVFLRQLAVLMPFALLGLIAFRGRMRESSLILGFLGVFWLAITAFFVCSRFRQPAMALLLPYSAAGIVGLWDALRQGGARRAVPLVALLAGLFLLTNQDVMARFGVLDLSLPNAPFHRYNLAVMLEEDGDLEGAAREYRAAREVHPDDPRISLNLGNALLRLDRVDEAVPLLEEAARRIPGQAVAVNWNLGVIAMRRGDWDGAIRRLDEVLRVQPGHPDAAAARAEAVASRTRRDTPPGADAQ
jgi:tetratricopeptide (TPR) repeat protein